MKTATRVPLLFGTFLLANVAYPLERTINGFDMTDPKSALEAYAKLRNADHITIAVTRRGSPMNIDYNIR